MDKSEIKSRVEKITAQVLKVDAKEITLSADFAFDQRADPMSIACELSS
jgi:acyl carrier protein